MKNKPLLSLSLFLLLVGVVPATAAEKKFTDFTIDVPKACQGEEKNGTVTVFCPDKTFYSLTLKKSGSVTGKALAVESAKQLNGSDPTLNDFGNYVFDAVQGGLSTKVELIEKDGMLLIYATDNIGNWPEDLGKSFDSITGNKPEIDAFVKQYLLE